MTSRTKRWIWIGAGVVVVGAGVGFWTTRHHSTIATGTSAVSAYLAESASKGAFTGQVSASGTIAPLNEATVQSPSQGSVSQLHVKLGQKVAKGQSLATLSTGQTRTSPITGTVVNLAASASSYVTAGQTLLTVANMNTVYANVSVSEDAIRNVKAGQAVTVTVPALPNKKFSGTVVTVGALGTSSSGGSVSYPVTVHINKPSGILLGMSASASITTGTLTGAVYVPTSAVETVNGEAEVLVPLKTLPTPSFGSGGLSGRSFGGSGGGFGGSGGGFGGGNFPRSTSATHATVTIPVAHKVVLGLTNGTATQIISGITGGEQILVPNPAAQTSNTTSGRGFGGGGIGLRVGFGGGLGG